MAVGKSLREVLEARHAALKSERSSWEPAWRDLCELILPSRGRFLRSGRAQASRRKSSRIINGAAGFAVRTLASGMQSGLTSPARPWFRLSFENPDLGEIGPAKAWLSRIERTMYAIFARSGLYASMPALYAELAVLGVAALGQVDDFDTVARFMPFTIGEYSLANDEKGRATTFYRETEISVARMVGQFGLERCSSTVRNLWDQGNTEAPIPICHAVEPNDERIIGRRDFRGMAYRSVYWEPGSPRTERPLRVQGYHECPVHAVRWDRVDPEVYGYGPGWDAIGDVRALQLEERWKAQGIELAVRPPTKGSATIKARGANLTAGGFTAVDPSDAAGLSPVYEVRPDLQWLVHDLQTIEGRINKAFYADLFLMLAQLEGPQMTAREVAERHEEKLLMLGPVLEQLNGELLDPVIDRTWGQMERAGLIPPPPPEIAGQEIKVEYISVLQQAQRSVGTGAIDRLLSVVGGMIQLTGDPTVADKLDLDQTIDAYAGLIGIEDGVVRPDDAVTARREQRQQDQAAAQAAAMASAGADVAQKLGNAKMSGGRTALDAVLGQAA